MIARVAAIVRADFLIRFRRVSTVVVFLLLSAVAYVWIPNPASGRALMHIGQARAIYNSAAIAIATALLASLFVGMFGFYVTSNAVKHDAQSRCGYILAATPMTKLEYVLGKFIGNALFLSTFTAGFMATSMAMVVVRGEAPLEPLVFVKQYLIVMPAVIVFVSMLAIAFESIRFLEGRFGDVAYFFVWTATFAAIADVIAHGAHWLLYFDITALATVIERMRAMTHSTAISIGASSFDPSKPAVVFAGFPIDANLVVQRITSMLVPLPLAAIATAAFHRFDPTRVRRGREKHSRSLLARLNAKLAIPLRAFAPSNALTADVLLTITSQPLIVVVAIGFALVGLFAPAREVLPIAFAAAAIAIADVACRDHRAGTLALIRSAPRLKEHFIAWKFTSSLLVALSIVFVPLLRSGAILPGLIGVVFVTAAATSLAIVSNNAKTFIIVFLSFWYIVVNARGETPMLDFAGFYGTSTPRISAEYLAVAGIFLVTAYAAYAFRLRRDN